MDKLIKVEELFSKVVNNTIYLPTVQRGFVWKPNQIENLWDSFLRGYPIGSFVVSKNKKQEDKYELLDGQQRATSLCLGFLNPLLASETNKILNGSNKNHQIFIDLKKPNSGDNRKFYIRVITKSHPWGYSLIDNKKTLESHLKNKALENYKIKDESYLKTELNLFWPYDAYKPIPLSFFIQSKNVEEVNIKIENWKKHVLKDNVNEIKVIDRKEIKSDELSNYYSIDDILDFVETRLREVEIHVLPLDLHAIMDSNVKSSEEQNSTHIEIQNSDNNDVENDNSKDEIENLFIRLNSGGTVLSGEELNYSILKNHIKHGLQGKIEGKCKGLFTPARFITIVYRLYNNSSKSKSENHSEHGILSMKVKPKTFQKAIRQNDEFEKYLELFLESNIIDNAKSILIYNKENNPIGLPNFITNNLSTNAPEIMFLLIYRLYEKEDKIDNEDLRKKVLGMITLFSWLGKSDRSKDYSKLLKNIWPCAKHFETERFWSSETMQRATINNSDESKLTALNFPNKIELNKIIPKDGNINSFKWNKIFESKYEDFIYKMFFEKELIIYAQRETLDFWYSELEQFDLEDTNRPFDWDHICPQKFIAGKKGIKDTLKVWYNSNGNFRAWKAELNRSDSDLSPKQKFSNNKDDLEFYKKHFPFNNNPKFSIQKELLDNSFCDLKWLDIDDKYRKNIKSNNESKTLTKLILQRNINLCLQWYEALGILNLLPKRKGKKELSEYFLSPFYKNSWFHDENMDKYLEGSSVYKFDLKKDNLYLYFLFNYENETINENATEFGLFQDSEEIMFEYKKMANEEKYLFQDNYLFSEFTLFSYSHESLIYLLKEFNNWILKIPNKQIRELAKIKFEESLKVEYRNKIISK